jgi:hypothetical protein
MEEDQGALEIVKAIMENKNNQLKIHIKDSSQGLLTKDSPHPKKNKIYLKRIACQREK